MPWEKMVALEDRKRRTRDQSPYAMRPSVEMDSVGSCLFSSLSAARLERVKGAGRIKKWKQTMRRAASEAYGSKS
jgi:hypothetical protein